MAKSVRVGCTYEYVGLGNFGFMTNPIQLRPGQLVKVVNVPGGFKGGPLRNVEDEHGNIHLVHVHNLLSQNARNRMLAKLRKQLGK